jgi:hypothetical protein
MRELELQTILLTMVEMLFPGGMEAFHERGGRIGIAPTMPPRILLSCKDSESVKALEQELLKRVPGVLVEVIPEDQLNFLPEELSPEEVQANLGAATQRISEKLQVADKEPVAVILAIGALVSYATIPVDITEENLAIIKAELGQVPGLRQLYVIANNECQKVETAATPVIRVHLEQSTRDSIIKADDVTDVQILLETCNSVDDFLNKI